MEQKITPEVLNGVGKRMRMDYLNGRVSASVVMAAYVKNKKEADAYTGFGYTRREVVYVMKHTHNPQLKEKIAAMLAEQDNKTEKSKVQNRTNLGKLEQHLENACGVGLRKVLQRLRKLSKTTRDLETRLVLMLLETEFANLSAKSYRNWRRGWCYRRKSSLLYRLPELLEAAGWRYGINGSTGKNANYLVFVYLPNGEQLTWHCNEFDMYEFYPSIDDKWDGQVCMTMEKIVNYIAHKYYEPSHYGNAA